MKKFTILLFTLAASYTHAQQRIKVLTYNIHHGENVNGEQQLQGIANVILATDPDLVALQEVDSVTNRSRKADQLKELAAQTGMYIYFGKAMNFDGGGYGTGILSKFPIRERYTLALPGNGGGSEPRAAAIVTVRVPGKDSLLQFVSTHLDHLDDPAARLQQVNTLLQHLKTGYPAIIAGDFNAHPEAKEIALLKAQFTDATHQLGGTWPSAKPEKKLDYIFLHGKNKWEVKNAMVVGEAIASDHRPVLCELELK
ncbi:endonuclease/exonuclease/phosphatase family protein [Chitinophaga horti]|uniref:Endonuclease/exonuclease/phosphatase family protein n=1 Tax=Chitinophaga horti TaxID=2920382 RepID=A0ABY6IW54_9BACT|nr:endonuclease/exonuclease/phosphatase family protein [Chitinophaga horti]UYQ91610.1 endonuclease/exonuclease/phosphatase family protein [Chitinophaga horti]